MSIDDLRGNIDDLDASIVDLLVERARIAQRIGDLKAEAERPAYAPEREAEIIRSLISGDLGPLEPDAVAAVFREIMSACRAVERRLRVAYLGPEHTFTHIAALSRFGHSCDFVAAPSIADIFRAVEAEQADLGTVPIQNSTEGVVGQTLDALLDTNLRICGELYVPVHHFLMALGTVEEIREVHSHPQVLAQCRGWLRERLPGVEVVATPSSGVAAARAAGDRSIGAIAPEPAAEAHGLSVLAANIEDLPNNRTRFFVVGDQDPAPTGRDKTSIVFSTPHRAGALHRALGVLAEHSINLTMIQSRPARGKLWEYVFFVDFAGHALEEPQAQALAALRDYCALVKVLGAYPDGAASGS
ncbi:MAG TPA: prephenate dehydratase [Armatimonadota bacterium]|nr:prephenate dehydratase [Armatimonadota bacterium]